MLDWFGELTSYVLVRGVRNLWGLAIVIVFTAAIISLLPLATAFEFGGDEGYEVIKAFMCSKGYKLYTEIWNDQPPVSTVLLTAAFRAWGPTILTARLVAAVFALLLLGVFHELVRERSGKWAALIGTFLLLASPGVLLLSVSVMLEVPAFATALLAAWLLFQWGKRRRWRWLVASGAVMAVALQIKLTAGLVLPAIGIELLLMSRIQILPLLPWRRGPGRGGLLTQLFRSRELLSVLFWGLALLATFSLIGMTWGKGQLASSWKSHTSSQIVPGMDRPEDHKFEPKLLSNHLECVIATAVCIVVAFRQKRLREVAFPIVLLTTVSAVHAVHRPWWNYYYLHLAIPLAWLGGWGLNEVIQAVFRLQPELFGLGKGFGSPSSPVAKALWRDIPRASSPVSALLRHGKTRRGRAAVAKRGLGFRLSSAGTWKVLALCAVVAMAVARSERRLEGGIKDLRARPKADDNPIVRKLKQNPDKSIWVYSESGIYPFHAGFRVIPELAIVMPKRFWSGQITTGQIIEACRLQSVEFVAIPVTTKDREWEIFLKGYYALAASDEKSVLYEMDGRGAK